MEGSVQLRVKPVQREWVRVMGRPNLGGLAQQQPQTWCASDAYVRCSPSTPASPSVAALAAASVCEATRAPTSCSCPCSWAICACRYREHVRTYIVKATVPRASLHSLVAGQGIAVSMHRPVTALDRRGFRLLEAPGLHVESLSPRPDLENLQVCILLLQELCHCAANGAGLLLLLPHCCSDSILQSVQAAVSLSLKVLHQGSVGLIPVSGLLQPAAAPAKEAPQLQVLATIGCHVSAVVASVLWLTSQADPRSCSPVAAVHGIRQPWVQATSFWQHQMSPYAVVHATRCPPPVVALVGLQL